MTADRTSGLLATVLVLTAAAGTVLIVEAVRPPRSEARTRAFQELVGGLGFGPAVDLSRCCCNFDPRLCPTCPHQTGPVPGGAYFCPEHASSIFYCPPLGSAAEIDWDERVP